MSIRQLHGFQDMGYGEVVSTGKGDAYIKTSKTKTDTLLFASQWKNGKRNFPMLNWQSGEKMYALWGSELSTFDVNISPTSSEPI